MQLITEIEIKNFRSIKHCKIKDIKDFNSLFGLNNSGKSNILRALNLFFNNETDNGQDLNFDFDFYQYPSKIKKKKEIKISVTFELPENFKFKKKLKSVEKFILKSREKRKLTIEKIFGREYFLPEKIKLNNILVQEKDLRTIDRFLNLINFRYIPNRVLPVDILKREGYALKKALARKLNKQKLNKNKIKKSVEELAKAIKDTSKLLIQPIAEEFKRIFQNDTTVELITPDNVEDLVSTSGYFVTTSKTTVVDEYQGAGVQSFLMFHTLHLIDKDYAQQFGWKQATIWAVEEPESSLHSDLEAQLAMFLFKTVIEDKSRLQFFCTTHSTMFSQYSQKSVIVEKKENETNCRFIESKNIYKESIQLGISSYTHPILFFPHQDIVLCEGKTDVEFIRKIFELLGLDQQRICITCLSTLIAEQDFGGVNTIQKYIKENKGVIKLRYNFHNTKICVLLDWDIHINTAWKQIKNISGVSVVQWPEDQVQQKTKKLKGIESLYPERFIDEAFKNEGFKDILSKDGRDNYAYSQSSKDSKNSVEQLKKYLSGKVQKELLNTDVDYLKNFITTEILGDKSSKGKNK